MFGKGVPVRWLGGFRSGGFWGGGCGYRTLLLLSVGVVILWSRALFVHQSINHWYGQLRVFIVGKMGRCAFFFLFFSWFWEVIGDEILFSFVVTWNVCSKLTD